MTQSVRVLVKPLLKPWKQWKYVTETWSTLSSNKEDAQVFEGNSLYKVQDYYFFSRLDYEIIESDREIK